MRDHDEEIYCRGISFCSVAWLLVGIVVIEKFHEYSVLFQKISITLPQRVCSSLHPHPSGKSFISLFLIPLLIFIELLFTEGLIDCMVPEHVYTNPKESHGKP